MSEIQIKGVWKEFGAQVVLENLNLFIEFVSFLGTLRDGR